MTGITSAEFLSNLPKKSKEDHERDKEMMKKMAEQFKDIPLNPKINLEQAIAKIKKLYS